MRRTLQCEPNILVSTSPDAIEQLQIIFCHETELAGGRREHVQYLRADFFLSIPPPDHFLTWRLERIESLSPDRSAARKGMKERKIEVRR